MAQRPRLVASIVHVLPSGAVGFTALSTDAYSSLFRSIDPHLAPVVSFQKPQEVAHSSYDVMGLARRLGQALTASKKSGAQALLVEMLEREGDIHVYDDLCQAIGLVIGNPATLRPWCISIAVADPASFRRSVFLRERLVPVCEDKKVGLILVSVDPTVRPCVLVKGSLPAAGELSPLRLVPRRSGERGEASPRLSDGEIIQSFQMVFGHFEIAANGTVFHVPAIGSVAKLAREPAFVGQLRGDVVRLVENIKFGVHPLGIPGGGIGRLALALVEGDTTRLLDNAAVKRPIAGPIVILCDFLSPLYPIGEIIRQAKGSGAPQVAVAAVASYQDASELRGVPCVVYVKTKYKAVAVRETRCDFCEQGVPFIAGEHFSDFTDRVGEFDPFTFWEFVSQDDDFLHVGHWVSDRTPNHYHFRIITDPIFKRHLYDLSIRLRNVLERKGILPGWVRKIVCTEGEESSLLAMGLSEVLGLKPHDVISIPRRFLSSIAGEEIDRALREYIEGRYGQENIRQQRVLIVDQAAHHFKTLSALRSVCRYYDCLIFAAAVFIDRTDDNMVLVEELRGSHYVALYSWHVPPRRPLDCPCCGDEGNLRAPDKLPVAVSL